MLYVEHLFRRSDNADARIFAKDAKKIILNANAFQQAENEELRGFLRYVVTGEVSTEYTRRIDDMVRTINNPDASVGVCCSHKVVAVGFNTLCYDASVGVLNPPHE